MSNFKYLNIIVVCLLLYSLSLKSIFAQQLISSWQPSIPITYPLASHVAFTSFDHVFVIGGSVTEGGSHDNVLNTNILEHGNLSGWSTVSYLPKKLIWQALASNATNVYILGGYIDNIEGIKSNVNTVYKSDINTDGTLSVWNTLTPLPLKEGSNGYSLGSSLIVNNRLYFAGGNTLSNYNASSCSQDIYMSEISPLNASIGEWTVVGQLPEKLISFGIIEINGYLYIFGGKNTSGVTSSVNRALIGPDGSIGPWLNDVPSLPQAVWRFGLTRSGDTLIVAGGSTTPGNSIPATDKVYFSTINSDGSITPWIEKTHLPNPVCCGQLVSWNNFIYHLGGVKNDSPYYTDEVWMAEIVNPPPPSPPQLTIIKHVLNSDGGTKTAPNFVINITNNSIMLPSIIGSEAGSIVTLSAGSYSVTEVEQSNYVASYDGCSGTILNGENKICTITNDDVAPPPPPTPEPPPSPIPVTKVFFAPGFGGSWNVDALLNCKKSGYSGEWTLAPFAKEIYNPLLENLHIANWDTKPYYYDWRQDVRSNASGLDNFINSNSAENEKVNIVGHSMGGLVGRSYVETEQGGKASKLLQVGTPNQGLAIAYPMVSGGEVWADDIVERIAANLYINHCGVPESAKNLLPTSDYLKSISSQQLKPISSMATKNNWLPTNFSNPFWGVKVGTIAGTGFPTLKIIDVKNPSKNDTRLGQWIDGVPVSKEKVNEGDGTVLVQSVQIPQASSNIIINQSHSGIVASTEGVSKILEFLGSPGIADPPYSDPTSALVIVGYPGNFWLKDSKGNILQSENGIITIFNPKSENYDMQVIPQSNETLVIVEQLLPNNKTYYKEYRLKGTSPKAKEIKFDLKHQSEDILKDKDNDKKPNFPDWDKYWWHFWEYWRKR